MNTVKIIEEKYVGNRSEVAEHETVDADDVKSAIERLDGVDRSSVAISLSNDRVFSAGGGAENQYVASLSVGPDDFLYTLIKTHEVGIGYVDLVVGGQKGSYPTNQCVDKMTLIKAALYFCEVGEPDPSLDWEEG